MLGAIVVVFFLLILFVVYTVVVLFFTFWYITIPVLALIIVYKKRKSIWKSKNQNRTFYKAKPSYYASAGEEELLTGKITPKTSKNYYPTGLVEKSKMLERLGLSASEARIVFGNNSIAWYDSKHMVPVDEICKIRTKIMFDLDYRKEVIHIADKIISMIESVICDNPVAAKRWAQEKLGTEEEVYMHNWEYFKSYKKTTFEVEIERMSVSEAYNILDLAITATIEQVRKRYRDLAKKWHPDKNDSAIKTEAEKKFVRINQAYERILENLKLAA